MFYSSIRKHLVLFPAHQRRYRLLKCIATFLLNNKKSFTHSVSSIVWFCWTGCWGVGEFFLLSLVDIRFSIRILIPLAVTYIVMMCSAPVQTRNAPHLTFLYRQQGGKLGQTLACFKLSWNSLKTSPQAKRTQPRLSLRWLLIPSLGKNRKVFTRF